MHIGSLLFRLLGQVLIDLLRRVARVDELLSQPLGIPLRLIPLQNHISFRIDDVSEFKTVNIMPPFVEEVLNSILSHMHERSLQESFLEVLILASVLQTIKSTLHSSLQEPVQNLGNTARAMGGRFMLSLAHRLRSVMPVLESLCHIEAHDPLGNLDQLSSELFIVAAILPDCFPASSHDLQVPFLHQFC